MVNLIAINLTVIGLVLRLVMGTPVRLAAQHVQGYFLVPCTRLGLILAASRLRDTPFDPGLTLAAALWQMAQALKN